MEYCYELGHYYENERGIDIFKTLGIFSTREKAEQAQIMYSKKPGFRDYPMDCFYIDKYRINVGGWDTAFCMMTTTSMNKATTQEVRSESI